MHKNTSDILSFWNLLKGYISDKTLKEISEYPLYTDAHIIGEFKEDCETYAFLNTVVVKREFRIFYPSIILRIFWYVTENRTYENQTDTSKYHGGCMIDEITALVSLKLGIRLKAGGMTRSFNCYNQDPLGRPHTPLDPIPQLVVGNKRPVLPNVIKSVNLANLAELKALQNVNEKHYISLVRAARLYQDALWIAESEPALAWLMLISAVETAANQWSIDKASPSENLRELKPDLAELLLKNSGGENLLKQVAKKIAPILGSTKKFIKFSLKFMPKAPTERPAKFAQVEWSEKNLEKILRKLYQYRSKALHGGIPFPEPMCGAPEQTFPEEEIPAEIGGFGLSIDTPGGSWTSEDLPININTFNYMVNGILNDWWLSLIR